jgi:hypothetical protein
VVAVVVVIVVRWNSKLIIGVTMRDMNYYEHYQDEATRSKICDTVRSFWEDEIRGDYSGGEDCEYNSDVSACETVPSPALGPANRFV